MAISVDLKFVGDFRKVLVYDLLRQSGDEGANAEQLALVGPACFDNVHMIFVGRIKLCLAGGLLDGVFVLLIFSQISNGSVIVSVVVDVSIHSLLG